jgi:hypothetical protein
MASGGSLYIPCNLPKPVIPVSLANDGESLSKDYYQSSDIYTDSDRFEILHMQLDCPRDEIRQV